jgi:serine/threonine protein kinase
LTQLSEEVRFPKGRPVSQEFRRFINAILTKNPLERPTSKKLLQMDFITNYMDFETCEELCK